MVQGGASREIVDAMDGVVFVATSAAIITIVALVRRAVARHKRDALATLADRLRGSASRAEGVARGTYRGLPILHRLTTRGRGEAETRWTEIECPRPAVPAALHIERHRLGDRAKVRRHEMVDLELGDRHFDRMYRVEGVPAEVVQRAIPPAVRGFLIDRRHAELETRDSALRFACQGWIMDAEQATAAWDALIAVEHGLRDGSAAVDRAHSKPSEDAPFRAEPVEEVVRRSREERSSEVAELERVRAQRLAGQAHRRDVIAAVTLALTLAGFFVSIALGIGP